MTGNECVLTSPNFNYINVSIHKDISFKDYKYFNLSKKCIISSNSVVDTIIKIIIKHNSISLQKEVSFLYCYEFPNIMHLRKNIQKNIHCIF